jgi:hypothetical protein
MLPLIIVVGIVGLIALSRYEQTVNPTNQLLAVKEAQTPALLAAPPQQAISINNADVGAAIGTQNNNIAAIGGVAAAAAAGILGAFAATASLAGPIGAAIAGIALLIKQLVSDTHLFANEIVQKYENPFGQFVIQIVQQVTTELNDGTLTLGDANSAYAAVSNAWLQYQQRMTQLASQGTDWYIVTHQSLNNLDNQFKGERLPNGKVLTVGMNGAYGTKDGYGFMSSWLDWLQARVTQLSAS